MARQPKVIKTPKPIAERLANAALLIAKANHYLVGFDAATTEGISFDDYSDAYQILIDRELRAHVGTYRRLAAIQHLYDLAVGVLGAACYRQHHTHLGR